MINILLLACLFLVNLLICCCLNNDFANDSAVTRVGRRVAALERFVEGKVLLLQLLVVSPWVMLFAIILLVGFHVRIGQSTHVMIRRFYKMTNSIN